MYQYIILQYIMILPLKWVGGKTKILSTLFEEFPKKFYNYHEIFIGGSSVLEYMLFKSEIEITGKVYAYDLNTHLINMYKHIQKNVHELCKELDKLLTLHNSSENKEAQYYKLREMYNSEQEGTYLKSALFILINHTCFRGMYRENSKGMFNTPYGNYKSVSLLSKEGMKRLSELYKDVTFMCLDFRESIQLVKEGDFMYLDPPYMPIKSNSFCKYTKNDFTLTDHTELFEVLKVCKAMFCMSNSNAPKVLESFLKYPIRHIECKRAISAKNPGLTAGEVLVKNYIHE